MLSTMENGRLKPHANVLLTRDNGDEWAFEVNPASDSDAFFLNVKTGKGLVSLLFPGSMPFEYQVRCVLR